MTFTFNGDISTDRNYVRLLCGDTSSARPGLDDETIDVLLAEYSNRWVTAAACRDVLLAQWQKRQELADRNELGDAQNEFDLQHGPAAWNTETARIRRRGLEVGGVKSVSITGAGEC